MEDRAVARITVLVIAAVTLAGAALALNLSQDDDQPRPELQRTLDGLVTGPNRVAPG